MTIGQKIKHLRTQNKLTQEKVADYLCISYQAVSKWEAGATCPDLSMIGPLTKLFHVTADELLCLNDDTHDTRYQELIDEYERTFYTEDFVRRQEICETAVREYPGDMRFLCNLAWVVSNRSFEHKEHEPFVAQQEKAIKLFDSVIKNCRDEAIFGEAIEGITQLLGWRGRYDEAKEYANLLPERRGTTQESVWENCLSGEERIRYKQKNIAHHLEGLCWELGLLPTGDCYTDVIETLLQTMFPDGNRLAFHHTTYYAFQKRVNHELRVHPMPDKEKIVACLRKMLDAGLAYDAVLFDKPGIYRYTAPWFDRIEEDTREWLGSEGTSFREDMKQYLTGAQFDALRADAGFCAIVSALSR